MSRLSRTRRFFHSGSALAVGGFLVDPDPETIASQVSTTLPPQGGYGAHRSDGFQFREIASFESASTEVIGNYDEATRTHKTLSTSIVKGLNVLGVVSADAVVARIASSYRVPKEKPEPQENPQGPGGPGPGESADDKTLRRLKFSIIGSHFVNLRIGGRLIEAKLMTGPDDSNRIDEVSEKLLRENPIRQPLFHSEKMHGEHIAEFGRVYIGEFYPDPHAPRLAMLRFELGCAVQGEVSFAIVQGGGKEWP